MAKQVFDNYDLVRQIYSFGDVGHREKMSRIRFSNHVRELEDSFHSTREPRRLTTEAFMDFVKTELCEEEHHLYAKALLRCQCCSRHSHYKSVPRKPVNPVPENRSFGEYCRCPCRRWYRAFKRHELV